MLDGIKNKQIEKKDLLLVVAFAILGYLFSMPQWIQFMNILNPILGFLVYEVITFIALYVIARVGHISIKGIKINRLRQIIGLFLITTSWFILVDWTNPYVQYVTTGKLEGASNVFYQSEDGASWFFWYDVLGIKIIEGVRILAFSLMPAILTFIGIILIGSSEKIEIKEFV